MTTTTPLPTRLRCWAETSADEYRARVLREAADELERQRVELAKLREEREQLLAFTVSHVGEPAGPDRYTVYRNGGNTFATRDEAVTHVLTVGRKVLHDRRNREQAEMSRRELEARTGAVDRG